MTKIFNQYQFGRLNEMNEIEYFVPTKGCLVYYRTINGRRYISYVSFPTEEQMNAAGWYRVVNVAEDGTDQLVGNMIYHYTGVVTDEPIEEEEGE